ncbi:hypothetical protein [Lysobacter gummosus]|uniref:hypothetical protein n=1 Tax=Lysobacter gummosus TaxID=262324 RepID=UPI003639B278
MGTSIAPYCLTRPFQNAEVRGVIVLSRVLSRLGMAEGPAGRPARSVSTAWRCREISVGGSFSPDACLTVIGVRTGKRRG